MLHMVHSVKWHSQTLMHTCIIHSAMILYHVTYVYTHTVTYGPSQSFTYRYIHVMYIIILCMQEGCIQSYGIHKPSHIMIYIHSALIHDSHNILYTHSHMALHESSHITTCHACTLAIICMVHTVTWHSQTLTHMPCIRAHSRLDLHDTHAHHRSYYGLHRSSHKHYTTTILWYT